MQPSRSKNTEHRFVTAGAALTNVRVNWDWAEVKGKT